MGFTVAIVGRPNVGKSTLFNRLVGQKLALVDDTPGVTRDRREGKGHLGDLDFTVIDTAGLEDVTDDSLEARMRRQTERAIADADVVLFLIDARAGVTPLDEHFARLLRGSKKPVILVANKCEGASGRGGLLESFAIGLGEPVPISAEHGEGLADLFQALLPHVPDDLAAEAVDRVDDRGTLEEGEREDDNPAFKRPLQLAIVGRPNAGKSTLINTLLGEDRLLTGPEAGITRDSITVPFQHKGRPMKLVDTAGIRRRSKVQTKLEKLSVADTLRSIRYAEIVILVIDATLGLEKQDLAIASLVVEEGRGLVLAVNKWDLVSDQAAVLQQVRDRLSISLPQVRGLPVVTASGLTGRNLDRLLDAAVALHRKWNFRVTTSKFNRWLEGATAQHPPPLVNGRRIKIRYGTQIKTRPPTIALFVTKAEDLPDSYTRYLVNSYRDTFDLDGTPIRVIHRRPDNPFDRD